MAKYQIIVLGLGAMGSAALLQLARRGVRVLGLDQFSPPHDFGSSHGGTRITRLAIGEGDHYTPYVQRSHELWREIEAECDASLLTATGGLIISSDAKSSFTHVENFFRNTVAAAKKYRIAHELLDAVQIRNRFPQFKVRDDEVGYFEPAAGFLRPEDCLRAQLKLAGNHGAAIHLNEKMLGFEQGTGGVTVTTDKGRYFADRLIVAAGAWLPQLLGSRYSSIFKVYRQVMFWFDVEGPLAPFLADRFPIFIWELQDSAQAIYGFPAVDGAGGGVKIASEQYEMITTPQAQARDVSDGDIAAMHSRCVAPYFSGVSSRCVKASTCLYTVTPDFGFVIDALPGSDRVTLVSACSGHGFKHSPAIGEALCDLVTGGRGRFDLGPFRLGRFA
jgi:sarcosine oxidase